MEIIIFIESEDKEYSLKQTKSLKNWIDDEYTSDIKASLIKKELTPDEAGAGLIESILTITLSAPAITILAKAVHVWLKEKTKQKQSERRKMKLKFTTENGTEIEIETENASETEESIIKSLKLLI